MDIILNSPFHGVLLRGRRRICPVFLYVARGLRMGQYRLAYLAGDCMAEVEVAPLYQAPKR